jgi:hypothetical protein
VPRFFGKCIFIHGPGDGSLTEIINGFAGKNIQYAADVFVADHAYDKVETFIMAGFITVGQIIAG